MVDSIEPAGAVGSSGVVDRAGTLVDPEPAATAPDEFRAPPEPLAHPSRNTRELPQASAGGVADLLDASPLGVALLTTSGRFLHANDTFCALTGYSLLELRAMDCAMLTHPDDRAGMQRLLDELAAGRRANFVIEKRDRRKDGAVIWVEHSVSVAHGSDGAPPHLIALCREITDRKQSEEALRHTEAQLEAELASTALLQEISAQLLGEQTEQAVYEEILDAAVSIMHADFGSMQRYHPERGPVGELKLLACRGFSPEAEQFWEWVRPDSGCSCGAAFRTRQRAVAADIERCEFIVREDRAAYLRAGIHAAQSTPLIARDGSLLGMISTHWRAPHEPSKNELRLLDILARQATDLLERTKSEHLLRMSERRFREMIDALPAAVYTTDAEGRLTHFNPAAVEFSGRVPELGSDRWCVSWKMYRPDGTPLPHDECPMAVALKEGRLLRGIEAIAERPDGTRIWFIPYPTPVRDAEGRIVGGINMLVDITERKQGESALQASEERHRALVSATASIVWTAAPDGSFAAPQISWEEYTGQAWDAHRWFGWTEAIHAEDRQAFMLAWSTARERRSVYEARGRLWCAPLSQYRHVVARAAPVLNGDGSVQEWIGMCTDVEVQWQAEERLRDVERIESVGRLAGGVAHEVNNQMTVVLGCADYLLRSDLALADLADVKHIRQAAERSAAITQQLLAFGRRQLLRPDVVDLNALLTDMSTVLQRSLGPDIAIELRLAPSACSVMADAGQVQQVVINLVLNARDAMPQGGTLRLETKQVLLPDQEPGSGRRELRPGAYCLLTVSDTGCGMDAATLGHAFEPFFTTKPFGQGNGLGLSSVYGTVKQSGGDIGVESEPGLGTTFKLYFPKADTEAASGQPTTRAGSPGQSAALLVAEDDVAVRSMICRALRDAGHRVIEAGDGQEAIELLGEAGLSLDLVIADVAMPRMGGLRLSEYLAQARPEVPTLFISGYPGSDMIARGLFRDGLPFLAKPFSPDALVMRVRQLLEGRVRTGDR